MDGTRKLLFFVSWTLCVIWVIVQLAKGQASEPECRTYVGPEFVDLQAELDVSLHGGFVIFGDDQKVVKPGKLTRWFYITDADNGTFWIDVWRPSGGRYKLVKSRKVNITSAGFHIIEQSKLQVQANDRFGIHFYDANNTITSMDNSSTTCFVSTVDRVPIVNDLIDDSTMTSINCGFALRASVDTQEDPCGHLYLGSADQGIRTERTISLYADSLGICSLRCLFEKSCVGFTYRMNVLTDEGYMLNVCDLNSAKLEDEVDNLLDDGNYTHYFHYK